MLHAAAAEEPDAPPVDAFVVRKATKQHGMQRLIEGPDVAGRDVLVVEDTSTTGASALTAVRGGPRGRGRPSSVWRPSSTGRRCAQEAIETEGVPYRALLGLADLGLG